jgi:hypothetical protein
MRDDDLRHFYRELRARDERSAPSVPVLLARRPLRRRVAPRVAVGLAAAASVVVAMWLVGRPRTPPALPDISAWRAPTDVLLEPFDQTLLRSVPALDASVIDALIPPSLRKGD